jgi:hypothetical protein
MNGSSRPFMLLRVRPRPGAPREFAPWFHDVHLADARRIPGLLAVRSGTTPGGTLLGFYTFESAETVQQALSSPEAAYARGTWEQWGAQLEELRVEIFAPLYPLPIFQSAS